MGLSAEGGGNGGRSWEGGELAGQDTRVASSPAILTFY